MNTTTSMASSSRAEDDSIEDVHRTTSMDNTTIKRTKVPIDKDSDEKIRVYFSREHGLDPMPSVTVIKDLRVDPEKEDALDGWRDRYDGKSNWARPWYKDQMRFKGYRGTLIHFAILSALGDAESDTYYHNVGESDWGYEEYLAEYRLKKWSKHAPSANTDEIPFAPRNNEYDGTHAWDQVRRDMQWATKAFKQAIIDGEEKSSHFTWEYMGDKNEVPNDIGRLDRDNVVAVEDFVYQSAYGYGGQFDLLYETSDGRTILADLKASSGVRFDHKLQSAAYKRAIESTTEYTIDETEVIRLDPDREIVEVSRSPDWDRTLDGLEHEFLALVDIAHNVEYSDALERAKNDVMQRATTTQSELEDSTA